MTLCTLVEHPRRTACLRCSKTQLSLLTTTVEEATRANRNIKINSKIPRCLREAFTSRNRRSRPSLMLGVWLLRPLRPATLNRLLHSFSNRQISKIKSQTPTHSRSLVRTTLRQMCATNSHSTKAASLTDLQATILASSTMAITKSLLWVTMWEAAQAAAAITTTRTILEEAMDKTTTTLTMERATKANPAKCTTQTIEQGVAKVVETTTGGSTITRWGTILQRQMCTSRGISTSTMKIYTSKGTTITIMEATIIITPSTVASLTEATSVAVVPTTIATTTRAAITTITVNTTATTGEKRS